MAKLNDVIVFMLTERIRTIVRKINEIETIVNKYNGNIAGTEDYSGKISKYVNSIVNNLYVLDKHLRTTIYLDTLVDASIKLNDVVSNLKTYLNDNKYNKILDGLMAFEVPLIRLYKKLKHINVMQKSLSPRANMYKIE